jgi:hypothetical protein
MAGITSGNRSKALSAIRVRVAPGATELTRMPRSLNSRDEHDPIEAIDRSAPG